MTPETKAIIEKEAHQFASSILGIPPRSIGDDDTIVTGYIAGASPWAERAEGLSAENQNLKRTINSHYGGGFTDADQTNASLNVEISALKEKLLLANGVIAACYLYDKEPTAQRREVLHNAATAYNDRLNSKEI